MEHKWYVDEVYIALIRSPLWITGKVFALFDKYIIDMLIVNGIDAQTNSHETGKLFNWTGSTADA